MIRGARLALARTLSKASRLVSPTQMAAGFRAGQTDRWSGDFLSGSASMNRILRADLATMRDCVRDLVLNDATAARIPTLFSENISGKDGIQYQAMVQSVGGEMDEPVNAALEDAWYRWAEDPQSVTAERRQTLPEVEAMLDELEVRDGETLVRLLPGFRNKYRFALQVLDIDQLDISYNVESDFGRGRNAIIMGVEVDEWGAAVAYHIWPNHPSETQRRRDRLRIPADQMLHTFLAKSPGQVRGFPWLAPIVKDLQHFGQFTEASVISARVSAAKMGFITDEEGLNDVGPGEETPPPEFMHAEAGLIPRLRKGERFVSWDPQNPNGNHEAFARAILHRVSSAVRLSYMSLSGDLSATSYSSGRMGYLSERGMYQTMQARKVLKFCRPVHQAWLPMALVSGQVALNRSDVAALSASEWHARSFPSIDPQKDAKTNAVNVAMGLASLTDLHAEEGRDIRTVFKKIAAERELAKSLGIKLHIPAGSATAVDEEEPANTGTAAPTSPQDDATDDDEDARASLPTLRVA